MTAVRADLQEQFLAMPDGLRVDCPRVSDGATLWSIAQNAAAQGTLDVNSPYSYLLWCRDFSGTSVVGRDPDGTPVGFITGYVRPERPRTLVVWQVAVDPAHRGKGLAAALLDGLTARVHANQGLIGIETTVTPGNTPSERLFTSFADRHRVPLEREVLFSPELFPRDHPHDSEVLYRIGPLDF